MARFNTVVGCFREQADRTPQSVALRFRDQTVTYEELDAASNRFAHFLASNNVRKGDLVAISLERSIELIEVVLGVMKAGAAYVPVDPSLPSERISFIMQDSEAKLLITSRELSGKLPETDITSIQIDVLAGIINNQPAIAPHCTVKPEDLMYLIYTSGSTGVPKGVMVPHAGVVNLCRDKQFVNGSPPQTFLLLTQLSFDLSAYEMYAALLNGFTLAIAEPQKPTPDSVIEAVKRYQVTALPLVTGLFHFIVEERVQDLASVRYLITGGDVMLPHLAEKAARELPDTTIINGYGPTENTIFSTMYVIPRGHQFAGSVPIGKPIQNVTTYILDKHNREVAAGQAGELVLGGAGLALGYWRRPDLTADRFVGNPFSEDPASLLHKTRDLVRMAPDGNIEFLGRIDQQVKIRGFRVELGDIENAILKYPAVRFCAVTTRDYAPGDKRLIAHVVPQTGEQVHWADLKLFLAEHLPEYMIPSHAAIIDALPLNASGKVDREALPKITQRPEMGVDYVEPSSNLETELAQIWRELLGIDQVGTKDNFFDLGGNSMLAARATVRMKPQLGDLSASVIYDFPTIAHLAARQQAASVTADDELDLAGEVQLDPSIQPTQTFDAAEYRRRSVLLTGATGFLGAYLVRELLRDKTIENLYCLVRANNVQDGLRRIKLNLEKYLLWDDEYASLIVAVPGHLERPRFGLSQVDWQELASDVDTIYHNGSKVSYLQSYLSHKPAVVTGTQNIIDFACQGVVKPVHYLSSIVSLGPLGFLSHVKTIYESDNLDRSEHVLYHDIGYAQAKWVAEKILLLARERGVPSTIIRPGFIMGESERGVNNTDDFMARLIKGCIMLGSYPYLPKQRKEFVPVDYSAKTVVRISQSSDNFNKEFHLVPPTHLSIEFDDFFTAIREQFGYELRRVPFAEWAQLLADSDDAGNLLTTFMPLFLSKTYKNRTVFELYENMSIYDSANTQEALRDSGIVYPELNPSLMRKYFDYMIDIGFIPPPPKAK